MITFSVILVLTFMASRNPEASRRTRALLHLLVAWFTKAGYWQLLAAPRKSATTRYLGTAHRLHCQNAVWVKGRLWGWRLPPSRRIRVQCSTCYLLLHRHPRPGVMRDCSGQASTLGQA
jgi:hypothetical protein